MADDEPTSEQPPADAAEVSRGERCVSVSRVIPAAPAQIFAVLADPAMHPVIDGSGTVKRPGRGSPERLELGSRFGMGMRWFLPYRTKNVVVEFDEDRRIAWRHFARHRWRFELEPVETGTEVVHSFDWSTALSPRFVERMGYPEHHPRWMEQTLERLEVVVTGAE